MEKIQTAKFVRKPFTVDAVQVTVENMEQVAAWCWGTIYTRDPQSNEDITPFIQVRVINPIREKQTKAYPGNWVLHAGQGFKVYTDKAFKATFDAVVNEDQNYGEMLPMNFASHNID